MVATNLVNVRLHADDMAKLRDLQRRGVRLSDLVRKAIRAEHEKIPPKRTAKQVRKLLQDIYGKYPIPDDAPKRDFDLRDRHAMQEAAARHFSRHNRKKA